MKAIRNYERKADTIRNLNEVIERQARIIDELATEIDELNDLLAIYRDVVAEDTAASAEVMQKVINRMIESC